MCIKKTLAILLNVLLAMSGLVLIGGAAVVHFILLKKLSNNDVNMAWVVTVLGIGGALAIIAAVLGLLAALCWEHCIPLILGVILIVIVIIMDLVFIFKIGKTVGEFENYLRNKGYDHMKEYESNADAKAEWTLFHSFGKCCGLNSASDWEANNMTIPISCCKSVRPDCKPQDPENRYQGGCFDILRGKLESGTTALKAIIAVMLIVQLAAGAFDTLLLVKMVACACCCKGKS